MHRPGDLKNFLHMALTGHCKIQTVLRIFTASIREGKKILYYIIVVEICLKFYNKLSH